MQLIIFIGVQASGKSTFYQQQFYSTHLRLNLDMLKIRHRENQLFEEYRSIKYKNHPFGWFLFSNFTFYSNR